jgi:hypothetical protein
MYISKLFLSSFEDGLFAFFAEPVLSMPSRVMLHAFMPQNFIKALKLY